MTTPKRHHFLPEFYQHGFTTGGYVWLFDRETGKYRREQPVNTAVIGHYYSFETDDGEKDPRIEHFLANVIEAEAKPVIAKLDRGESITADEKESLSYFASFLHFRVPRFQRYLDEMVDGAVKALTPFMVQSIDDLKKDLAEIPGLTDEQRNMPPEALYNFMMGGQYKVSATQEFRLQMMISLATDIQNYFRQMDWSAIHAPKGTSFVTTDAPLVVVPPDNYDSKAAPGFITPGAKKLLPLTSNTLLIMGDRGDKVVHGDMSKSMVRTANIFVVNGCERFVIGRDEAHVRSLVSRTQVDRRPRTQLIHVG